MRYKLFWLRGNIGKLQSILYRASTCWSWTTYRLWIWTWWSTNLAGYSSFSVLIVAYLASKPFTFCVTQIPIAVFARCHHWPLLKSIPSYSVSWITIEPTVVTIRASNFNIKIMYFSNTLNLFVSYNPQDKQLLLQHYRIDVCNVDAVCFLGGTVIYNRCLLWESFETYKCAAEAKSLALQCQIKWCVCVCVCTDIHTCIHAYIDTCLRTHTHAYIHTHVHT